MVRAPCCEKMGLKRGPWTPEEDEVLISHINKHGHSNWRALPKQAGLLRCGKSCRLRWTNYLRPDIKRGNFTREEEDTIIKLHSMLGNRWSAIAARLPGRTDNEIKNLWHTHLKKRLKVESNFSSETKPKSKKSSSHSSLIREVKSEKIDFGSGSEFGFESTSPQPCSSATDASVISWETHSSFDAQQTGITELMPPTEQSFSIEPSAWVENYYQTFGLAEESDCKEDSNLDDCMEFWFNLLLRADELPELPEF